MIIRRFLHWVRSAAASERARGAGALARAYVAARLSPEERREAEAALLSLLDDTSAAVRRAVARELGSELDIPRHLVLALARDQSDVAALVLARSPLLMASDLVDCVEAGDALAQTAVAVRPGLPLAVASALVAVGAPDALVALAENHGAPLPEFLMHRMLDRHAKLPALREALLARPGLPAAVRQRIAVAVAEQLTAFVARRRWLGMERAEGAARESGERTVLTIAATAPDEPSVAALVRQLRQEGRLTPRLLLRGLLSGEERLFAGALAELAEVPPGRVAALAGDERGRGREALLERAGIPVALRPAFLVAWSACRAYSGHRWEEGGPVGLFRPILERVIAACASRGDADGDALTALLRRFEAEIAREEARGTAARLAESAALGALIEADRAVIEGQRSVSRPIAA